MPLRIVLDISGVSGGEGAVENSTQTVTFTIRDDDTAGFTVAETSGTSVTEGGSTDTFTVVLDSKPTGNVVFALTDNDTDNSEISYSPTTLTFTTGNWNSAQTVTVTGVDDAVDDGDISSGITIAINTGSTADSAYDSVSSQTVTVTTTDDDTAGFTIAETSSSTTVAETGSTDTFTVVLNSEPTGNVVFALTDNDTDNTEISYSPTALTFTSGNWNSAQTVTVTGVDDSDVDGTITSGITVAVNTGSCLLYTSDAADE